jgi:hypothetical protein
MKHLFGKYIDIQIELRCGIIYMKNWKTDILKISSLFDFEPEIGWGSRGNPHLWDEMRLKSKEITLLKTNKKMKEYFYELYLQITGCKITDEKTIKIEKYILDGGISNGIVTSSWWINDGIPILLGRYNKLKMGINLFDCNDDKFHENGIEAAVNRIFTFEKINVNNLIELILMDNNFDRISNKTKYKIINEINSKDIDENRRKIIYELLFKSKTNGT